MPVTSREFSSPTILRATARGIQYLRLRGLWDFGLKIFPLKSFRVVQRAAWSGTLRLKPAPNPKHPKTSNLRLHPHPQARPEANSEGMLRLPEIQLVRKLVVVGPIRRRDPGDECAPGVVRLYRLGLRVLGHRVGLEGPVFGI